MRSRSCAITAVVIVLVLAVTFALLWRAYMTVPVIKPPVVKMPSPNAFDYFVKAGKQLRDVPNGNEPDWRDLPAARQELVLKHNQQALATLREGLKYDYMHPLRYGIDALYPEYSGFRNIARLLALDGQSKSRAGDWPGAMRDHLDGILMGQAIPNDGNSVGKAVGCAVQTICRREAWPVLQHLDSSEATAAILLLKNIERHHLPMDKSLEQVRTSELLGLQYHLSGKCKDPAVKDWIKLPRYIKAKIFRNYTGYMNKCIENVKLPYAAKPQFPELSQSKNKAVATALFPADLILIVMCVNCDTLWFADVRCQAENRLLMAGLALRAYRLDRGRYPDKLAQLVPRYLKSLPDDPFALKGSFGYRREGDRYVLWSLGPDCKDDGGKPICDAAADPEYRYSMNRDSLGDIVAGVNK